MAVQATQFIHDSDLIGPSFRGISIRDAEEMRIPLEGLLTRKRWLQYPKYDYRATNPAQFHMFRRILETYDPATRTVLLSKKGSGRLRDELSTPDRRYSLEELYSSEFLSCVVRPAHGIFNPFRT